MLGVPPWLWPLGVPGSLGSWAGAGRSALGSLKTSLLFLPAFQPAALTGPRESCLQLPWAWGKVSPGQSEAETPRKPRRIEISTGKATQLLAAEMRRTQASACCGHAHGPGKCAHECRTRIARGAHMPWGGAAGAVRGSPSTSAPGSGHLLRAVLLPLSFPRAIFSW